MQIKSIEAAELKDKEGNTILTLDQNPGITFTVDVAPLSEQISSIISGITNATLGVSYSAAEASRALREFTNKFLQAGVTITNSDETLKASSDVLEELANKCIEIGCINPVSPEEIAAGLLRAQTLEQSENPNQKEPFDFLEQNAYDEADSGWLTPLDSI